MDDAELDAIEKAAYVGSRERSPERDVRALLTEVRRLRSQLTNIAAYPDAWTVGDAVTPQEIAREALGIDMAEAIRIAIAESGFKLSR